MDNITNKKKIKLEELKAKALNEDIKEINEIFNRILEGNYTKNDIDKISKKILTINISGNNNLLKIGNTNISINEGRDIHIGDCIYQGESANNIRNIVEQVVKENNKKNYEKIDERIRQLLKQQEKERLLRKQQEQEYLRQQQHYPETVRNKDYERISVLSGSYSQNNSNTVGVRVRGF